MVHSLRSALRATTRATTRAATRATTRAATRATTRATTRTTTRATTRATTRTTTRATTRAATRATLLVASLTLVLTPILGAVGCGKEKKPPPAPVVECEPFCHKTFETCGREVFIASGKLRVDKAKVFNVLGILEKVKAEGLEKCRKGCEEHQGLFSDAKGVNDCMKIQDCEKFAACIVKFVK